MSDDLVKRLRGGCVMLDVPGYECVMEEQTNDLCIEAADRIEHLENRCANLLVGNGALNIRSDKLEAALTHIYAWYPISIADPHQTIEEIRKFARNSLEGDDD
jgi:hypothetical protein